VFDDIPQVLADAVRALRGTEDSTELYVSAAGLVIAFYLRADILYGEDKVAAANSSENQRQNGTSHKLAIKIMMMGEILFDLRNSPGFAEFCQRSRGRHIRPALYELFAAISMQRAAFEISARPETGSQGQDFDFAAARQDEIINVGVTALTAKAFLQNTVRRALNQKRRQIPTDRPAIIFCVIPDEWQQAKADIAFSLQKIAFDFFANSKRVNAIAFVQEYYRTLDSDRALLNFPLIVLTHPAPRLICDLRFLFGTSFRSFDRSNVVESKVLKCEFYQWVHSLTT
jgi:hypothetical protein